MKTIRDSDFELKKEYFNYNYQPNLTTKLDSYTDLFSQETINEIVLWKVNRYASLSEDTLILINQIGEVWNEELTKKVLRALLSESGIRLPMASTILRFKNKNIYQIIDQRVYRILGKGELKHSSNIEEQIELYIGYLKELHDACIKLNIPFDKADRILYEADKGINGSEKIKY
jgi:hypothetical protein